VRPRRDQPRVSVGWIRRSAAAEGPRALYFRSVR